MNTETTEISQREIFAADSSRAQRAEARFEKLAEATLNALRKAGLEREAREQEALALKESPPDHRVDEKKPTMPAA